MDTHRTTVLACIDGSTWKEAVVDYAAWVSRTVDAPLKLLHSLRPQWQSRPGHPRRIAAGTDRA